MWLVDVIVIEARLMHWRSSSKFILCACHIEWEIFLSFYSSFSWNSAHHRISHEINVKVLQLRPSLECHNIQADARALQRCPEELALLFYEIIINFLSWFVMHCNVFSKKSAEDFLEHKCINDFREKKSFHIVAALKLCIVKNNFECKHPPQSWY